MSAYCSIPGCLAKKHVTAGLCSKHYARLRKHGDPEWTRPSVADRFHAKHRLDVDTGCWLWTAAKNASGYGTFQIGKGSPIKAHRLSWQLTHGPIPIGLFVLHRCDTPSCVNPSHLFLGTPRENSADMRAKGRQAYGEKNTKSKLTLTQVRDVLKSELSSAELARRLDVSPGTIEKIRSGKTWRASHLHQELQKS